MLFQKNTKFFAHPVSQVIVDGRSQCTLCWMIHNLSIHFVALFIRLKQQRVITSSAATAGFRPTIIAGTPGGPAFALAAPGQPVIQHGMPGKSVTGLVTRYFMTVFFCNAV